MNRRHVAEQRRQEVVRNTAAVQELIGERVRASHGLISAKRLLPIAELESRVQAIIVAALLLVAPA